MYQTFRFQRVVLLGAAIGTAGLVFAAPQCCARALQQGLALCGGPLLVSLFPFLIVSTLLMRCGAGQVLGFVFRPVARLIGVRSPAAGGVLLIGFLGGFAPAAAAVAEAVRSRELTPQEASALLPACICSGPSFVILTAGEQLLGSRVLGIRLFAAQVLAGYLTAALLNRLHPAPAAPVRSAQSTQTAPPRLDEVIAQAAVQYLKLCGFVLYFRMLAAGCGQFLPAAWAPFPAMLLEVCSGCDYAARTGLWASSLCCAALSVQGASVLLQVRTLCPGEVSFRPLLAGRFLHLPLSLALFCLTWPEQAVETFGNLCERVIPMQRSAAYVLGESSAKASSGGFFYLFLLNPAVTFMAVIGGQAGRGTPLADIVSYFGIPENGFIIKHWIGFSILIQLAAGMALINRAIHFVEPIKHKKTSRKGKK